MFEIICLLTCLSIQDTQPVDSPALIRGGVWLPRLGGTIEDGGSKVDFETNIDLRSKETVPMVEFSLTPVQDFTFSMSFFDFSTSGSGEYVGNDVYGGMTLNAGDNWNASTQIQSVGFEAAWSIWKPFQTAERATLSFAPVVGLRWFGVDTQLGNTTISQEVSHKNSWVSLQAGLEMEFRWDTRDSLDWADSVSIEAQLLIGSMFGADGGAMASVQAGLSVDFSPSIGGFFGYRLQELRAEDGDYSFDAGLQGLFVGGEIRF
ncbi:MAG: hypothetical protein H8E86_03280 [Planctomycetes bacterium]|nr:hypothetical protein [Planctomycetota bacterium]